MRLFLLRHGQSKGNINQSEYFNNHDSDIELTEKGEDDSLDAADKIINIMETFTNEMIPSHFKLVHSTYKRAIQTADIISTRISMNPKYNIDDIITTPLCREREWGSLREDIQKAFDRNKLFNFYHKPVGGESFADCFTRVAIFHQWLESTTKYQNNVIVAHGEFNKLYLMYLLNWDIDEFNKWNTPRNGEVYLIDNGKLSPLTPLTPNTRKN